MPWGLVVFALWSLFCYGLGSLHVFGNANSPCLKD